MDFYRRLDVTEKVLSIIVAVIVLLGAISTLVGYNFGKINSLKDVHAIKDVIDREGQAVVEKNTGILDDIFASDALVIHCPAPNEDRNVVHRNLEDIKDRYTKFFPLNWQSLSQVDLSITVEGNKATATSQGIVVNAEEFIKFEAEFKLEKENGRWIITRFECGL